MVRQQNTGRLILQQDVVDPNLLPADGKRYEAWVWLGGAGRDDMQERNYEQAV